MSAMTSHIDPLWTASTFPLFILGQGRTPGWKGRTKALLTIRIGKEERQFEKTVAVSSRAYTGMGNGRVGIGIGIGIGGHSRGGIGIGFGDW